MINRTASALAVFCALASSPIARAQDPYNLNSPVKHLATIFTDLYGPNGLIVDSEATLPNEQPHTAHFNNDFQAVAGSRLYVPVRPEHRCL